MPRTTSVLAAPLAAFMIAASPAPAWPADDPRLADDRIRTSSLAGTTSQDLRSPHARDAARPKTPSDLTAALVQERYYSSYGEPDPLTPKPAAADIRSNAGIAPVSFAFAVLAALIIGLATGSGLQLLRARRRHATSLAT